jgi:hypothetical protein
MSIGEQIRAFLEVSEKFLRQARVELASEGWATLEEAGITRCDRNLKGGALLDHHVAGHGGTDVIGNQGGGVMRAYGQDGARARPPR